MRPHGRATVSIPPRSPWAICDKCGFLYDHRALRWLHDYRGRDLQNLRLLVCETCLDKPQEQLRIKILTPDPEPVANARPASYQIDEVDFRTTSGQDGIDQKTGIPVPGKNRRTTQDGAYRVPQQTGEPPGGLNTQPGTDPNAPGNDDPGLPYGNTDVPKTGA